VQYAVNYSRPLVALLRDGRLQLDLLKCPAWPEEVAASQALQASYVHFPLVVGSGRGRPLDSETGELVDWRKVERLRRQTDTPFVNLHLHLARADYPDLPYDADRPDDLARMIAAAVRDVTAVTERFGAEWVVIENIYAHTPATLLACARPSLIRDVIEATQTGLLLDISHSRLAARQLGCGDQPYLDDLPVARLREMHVTGLYRVDQRLVDRLTAAGANPAEIAPYLGQEIDHAPMTDADWSFFAWALAQIERGEWAAPDIIAFEYGGVSPIWEAVTSTAVLCEQNAAAIVARLS
jgi:uncharacterized protein